jgi:hypothetical protein
VKRIPEESINHLQHPLGVSNNREDFTVFESKDFGNTTNPYSSVYAFRAAEQLRDKTGGSIITLPRAVDLYTSKQYDLPSQIITSTQELYVNDTFGDLVTSKKHVYLVTHGYGTITARSIANLLELKVSQRGASVPVAGALSRMLEETAHVHTVDDLRNGKVKDIFGRFAVYVDASKLPIFGQFNSKKEFMNNDLFLARFGSEKLMESYFELVRDNHDEIHCGTIKSLNEEDHRYLLSAHEGTIGITASGMPTGGAYVVWRGDKA